MHGQEWFLGERTQPLEEWGYKMEPQHLEGWVHLGEVELQEEQRHWKEPVSLEAGNPDLQLAGTPWIYRKEPVSLENLQELQIGIF